MRIGWSAEHELSGHRAHVRPDGRKVPVYSRPTVHSEVAVGLDVRGRHVEIVLFAGNRSTVPSMTRGRRFLHSLCVCVLMMTMSLLGTIHAENTDGSAPSSSVTLAWDQSSDPTVKGYRLHYGFTSGRKYLHVLDVGKTTSWKLSNLIPGKKYYAVIMGYNASGKESIPSKEISFTAPKSAPTPHP
jgi:hypothetical protein